MTAASATPPSQGAHAASAPTAASPAAPHLPHQPQPPLDNAFENIGKRATVSTGPATLRKDVQSLINLLSSTTQKTLPVKAAWSSIHWVSEKVLPPVSHAAAVANVISWTSSPPRKAGAAASDSSTGTAAAPTITATATGASTAIGSPTSLVGSSSTTPPLPLTPNGTQFEIPPPYSAIDLAKAAAAEKTANSNSSAASMSSSSTVAESVYGGSDDDARTAHTETLDDDDQNIMAFDPTMNVMEAGGGSDFFDWFGLSPRREPVVEGEKPQKSLVSRILFGKGEEEDEDDDEHVPGVEEESREPVLEQLQQQQQQVHPLQVEEGLAVEVTGPVYPSRSVKSVSKKPERGLVARILFGKGEDSDEEESVEVGKDATETEIETEMAAPVAVSIVVESADEEPADAVHSIEVKAPVATAKPERGFWTRVLYGRGDDAEDEEEQDASASDASTSAANEAIAEPETQPHEPTATTTNSDSTTAQTSTTSASSSADTTTPPSTSGDQTQQQQTSQTPITLPTLRNVGKLVQSLPGVSLVTRIPGSSIVSQLPGVSNVLDALFVDHEESGKALAVATVTPQHIIDAGSIVGEKGKKIEGVGVVPVPKGSVVDRRIAAASMVASAVPLTQKQQNGVIPSLTHTAKQWTDWGIVKTLGVASSSANLVNAVGDLASDVAGRIRSTAASVSSGKKVAETALVKSLEPSPVYAARDVALNAASSFVGYVASNRTVAAAAAAVVPGFVDRAVRHSLCLPGGVGGRRRSVDEIKESGVGYLAEVDSFRHFCAFPPGQIRNPLSFSFGGGCGVDLGGADGVKGGGVVGGGAAKGLLGYLPSGLTGLGSLMTSTRYRQREARYAVGAARVIREKFREDVVDASRYLGSGFGAVVAAAMALGLPLEGVEKIVGEVEAWGDKRFLGSVATLSEILKRSLESYIPDNISTATDRLFVSVTKFPSFENVIVSEFASKEELIKVLLGSCYLPVIHETPIFHDGSLIVSGALTNPLPVYDGLTVTISSLSDEANVKPFDASRVRLRELGYAVVDAPIVVPASAASATEDKLERWTGEGEKDMEEWLRMISASGVITMLAFKFLKA
ncbi:hypothetical protein HDU97_007461 [Phlyctochytrium planicorne]|nr:hypothetical protein HDU97_007461 [Phlyctochytrium planicorne]